MQAQGIPCRGGAAFTWTWGTIAGVVLGVMQILITYQPTNRFWTFQWIETGIYVGFSVLALCAAFWLVRRLNCWRAPGYVSGGKGAFLGCATPHPPSPKGATA